MAERRVGTVVSWERLSPILAVFRLVPQAGSAFPEYKAGQYIALRREDCKLTKRVMGEDGKPHYEPYVDELARPRIGPVTHSYSISSAPFETREQGYLEFYIVLEVGENEYPGRLTESLFRLNPPDDDKVGYVNHIAGDFTLEKRAAGFRNVVMVGTGTGLAPFAAMVKQLHHDASAGNSDSVAYTLFHANRSFEELAFHAELLAIEKAQRFDFLYVPSVSRPTPRDLEDPSVGKGRANNLLRHALGMPSREEEELSETTSQGLDETAARKALKGAARPVLPSHVALETLRARLEPGHTVVLTCGNPSSMADIKRIAEAHGVRYEKEDWKLVLPARS